MLISFVIVGLRNTIRMIDFEKSYNAMDATEYFRFFNDQNYVATFTLIILMITMGNIKRFVIIAYIYSIIWLICRKQMAANFNNAYNKDADKIEFYETKNFYSSSLIALLLVTYIIFVGRRNFKIINGLISQLSAMIET